MIPSWPGFFFVLGSPAGFSTDVELDGVCEEVCGLQQVLIGAPELFPKCGVSVCACVCECMRAGVCVWNFIVDLV